MKITFPHMGNTYVVAKSLLDDLGIDYVIPPYNNKEALEIGTRLAPEMACLPLKINLGNYIQSYRQGADTVLITGGHGPCRFGYYCELEREILKDNGFDMDFIVLEWPYDGLREFIRRVRLLTKGASLFKIVRAIRNVTRLSIELDELELLTYRLRPRERRKGSVSAIYKDFHRKVQSVKGTGDLMRLVTETRERLLNIESDPLASPLRVGIVGEIYTTIDPYANFFIAERLGDMGVEVHRTVSISEWIVEHILKSALHLPRDTRYVEAARPYLGAMIGGHAQQTIGNAVMYARDGYDGVIQIYPLTCMPEIVAESIMPAVGRDFGIPTLTLIVDEMTGEAGYLTRVEAFVDLLKRRKEEKVFGT